MLFGGIREEQGHQTPKPPVAGSNPATPAKEVVGGVYRSHSRGYRRFGSPHKVRHTQRFALGLCLASDPDCLGIEFPLGSAFAKRVGVALVAP